MVNQSYGKGRGRGLAPRQWELKVPSGLNGPFWAPNGGSCESYMYKVTGRFNVESDRLHTCINVGNTASEGQDFSVSGEC